MLLSNFLSLTPLLETTIFLSVPDEKHNSFFREEIFDRNYIFCIFQRGQQRRKYVGYFEAGDSNAKLV